ncbi:MAG: D-alanyl-D-alanine carboxypeptidase family protein [Woeseiaceae bacterium]|jgi:D-alanyl-D-alanine carboxypeptidase (penicillin-binding protein 5/6)|nr:D-alanyl-D-alanine carboxypeptidase family protein [Woeseiaceae bacterium]
MRLILTTFTVIAVLCFAIAADAQPRPAPAPPVIGAKSYLVTDATTGSTLAELDPDLQLAPASLTKLMTAYVVFDALKQGQIALDDTVTISEKAWRMGGSRMFVEVGKQVSVENLLLGMIVQSGNDASVALAEYVAGSEGVFAEMMNQYSRNLGMTSSNWVNSTGWPADDHYTTARDLAVLTRALVLNFPDYYRWYSVREFTWNDIRQPNRNSLLWRDDSVDGVKTGHTDDAGYCLVSSAERDGMRVIAVVMGTASENSRITGSQAMINYAFRFFETRLLYKGGEAITSARVWKSANEETPLGVTDDLYITVPRGTYDELESTLDIPATLVAPIAEGQPVAELAVSLGDSEILRTPVRALEDNPTGSIWQRLRDTVSLWFE